MDGEADQQAPQSAYTMPELFEKAEAAHEEAEKKEDAEHAPEGGEQIKETEPTNVPGAEMPAVIADEYAKKEVEEDINKEAPVPLEEAAPTPSDEEKTSQPAPSLADTDEKAGAQQVRLGEVDAHNAQAKEPAAGGLKIEKNAEEEKKIVADPDARHRPDPNADLAAMEERKDAKAEAAAEEKKLDVLRQIMEEQAKNDLVMPQEEVEEVKVQEKPKVKAEHIMQPHERPAALLDPDEIAAAEERAEYQARLEREGKA